MQSSPVTKVVDDLRKTLLRQDESDGQLLDRFLEKRDETAFAALVRRHGPMVWGVCKRIVNQASDAEDAFQAAFLILVRKAATVKPRAAVGNWLYGVACRTAWKAKTTAARMHAREKQVTSMPERGQDGGYDREELQMVLDQELSALPDKYRLPVVLCDLEGRTRKEVAAQLKIPEGTLSSRRATALQMLAKRLARHGLAVAGGALVAALSQNAASACVPASVVSSTIKTATLVAASHGATVGVVSARVATLAEGVLRAMLLTQLKLPAVALLVLIILGVSVAMYSLAAAGDEQSGTIEQKSSLVTQPPQAKPNEEWHPFAKNTLVAIHIERALYEVLGEKRFLMAIRLTNVTDVQIGVDLRGGRPGIYPNQWTVSDTDHREIVSERRVVHVVPDHDILRADFNANLLTPIPAGQSITVFTEFNNSGRPEVDRCKGKHFIVSMDGQVGATDGKAVEIISCAWTSPRTLQTDVILPFPVTWKVQAGKGGEKTKEVEGDQEKLQGTWAAVSVDREGKSLPADDVKALDILLTIKGHEFMLMPFASKGPEHFPHGTFTIDPTKNPKQMNMTVVVPFSPVQKTTSVLGIYDVDGDTLKLLRGQPNQARPQEFKTTPGSGLEIIVFRRVAAGPDAQKPIDPRILEKLAIGLRSKVWEEKSAAVLALAKLLAGMKGGGTDFGPVIEPLFLNAGWGGIAGENARMAENALVRIGAQAAPYLCNRLKSADAHDRRVAAELLVRIGPRDVALVKHLQLLLTDSDHYVRKAAIEGLGTLGATAKETVDDLERVATTDPNLARRVGARIALIRVAGVSDERVRALAAFLEMKDKQDDDAKGDKNQSRKEAAMYAASALGELGPNAKAAEAQLLAALKNPEFRSTAARTLGEIGTQSPEAITALIDLLMNHPDREARRSAAAALGAFGPAAKAAIPALRTALKGDERGGWWVAADTLGKIGGPEVVPILIEGLMNPDDDIRLTAIRALGNLGILARPALAALEKARREDSRDSNRAAAAQALRRIEN